MTPLLPGSAEPAMVELKVTDTQRAARAETTTLVVQDVIKQHCTCTGPQLMAYAGTLQLACLYCTSQNTVV